MTPYAFTDLRPQVGQASQELIALLCSQVVPVTFEDLASATRTAGTNGPDRTNYSGAARLMVRLNITAASGTGGLRIFVACKNLAGDAYAAINSAAAAITTTGIFWHFFGPGISGGGPSSWQVPIGVMWQIQVTHADASNYTYSVSTCLLP